MFENQYLITQITNKKIDNINNFKFVDFGEYRIYYNDVNQIGYSKKIDKACILLGSIYDPIKNIVDENEIAKNSLNNINSIDDFINNISFLGGRFIAIYFEKGKYYIFSDALGLKNIYYITVEEFKYITSNPTLLYELNIIDLILDDETKGIINNVIFKKKEMPWSKDEWYDKRIKKLLPNWYLKLNNMQINHIKYFYNGPNKINDIIHESSSILKNSISLMTKLGNCIMPVTAGRDSRVLLAASKQNYNKISYYIFKFKNINKNDILIPKKIFKQLNIKFNIIDTDILDINFIDEFKKNNIIPRILPKTRNIQWHYNNSRNKKIININGNGGEIFKNNYENQTFKATIYKYDFFKEYINKWSENVEVFSKKSSIDINDLYYWEIRMGIWGSQFPLEQDIAIEELTPFNNRYLIYMLLNTKKEFRSGPDYSLLLELIDNMWSDLNLFEYNPIRNIDLIKLMIKKLIRKILGKIRSGL